MIEPTETESKETLDDFVAVMEELCRLAGEDPDRFHLFPETTPVSRLDETKAAKDMDLCSLEQERWRRNRVSWCDHFISVG
jgi:glycine dehydrogenase subunit 2